MTNFIDDIFDVLCNLIRRNCNKLSVINQSVASAIEDCKHVNLTSVDPQNPSTAGLLPFTYNHDPLSAGDSQNADTDNSPNTNTDLSVEKLYSCPICDKPAGDDTIACEECDEWYHLVCVGLSSKNASEIHTETPFICNICNDTLLYESTGNTL